MKNLAVNLQMTLKPENITSNMFNLEKVKGVIFDYGGTIDSNGKHWAWVIWDAYQAHNIPVTKEQFKEAYVYGERYLATHHVIMPEDNFQVLMHKKIELQISYLLDKGFLTEENKSNEYSIAISKQCYNFARDIIKKEVTILDAFKKKYPLVLVSNFYGNVQAVLKDFGLLDFFEDIIESAIVGVRKPNPAIFGLGVEKLALPAENIVVIGDSYEKDIIPASKNGCQTVWLQGPGWEDKVSDGQEANIIITDFNELRTVFQLS